MGNQFLNISMITNEALRELKNQLGFSSNVNRQYDDKFAVKGAKIGDTINIRKPQIFAAKDGANLQIQDVVNESVPLVLDKRKHVAFQFSAQDLTLNIDRFSELYIKPAITALANQVDFDGLTMARDVIYNAVGTPGTQPATAAEALALALAAGQKLDENGCPMDGRRSMLLNPASQAAFVKGLSGLYNAQDEVAKQYKKGRMFDALGFKWGMDQNIRMHSTGAVAGAPAVDTTISTEGVDELHLDGITGSISGCYKKGDVITVEGVFAVNPQSKESTGSLMQFVVTADTDSDTGEIAALPISPAIYMEGPKKNVSAYPADGGLVKLFGHATSYASKVSPSNIAYHSDAFALGTADLEMPKGVDMAARASDPDSGLSIRVVRDYDINTDFFPCRLDILYGWKDLYPQLACKVMG